MSLLFKVTFFILSFNFADFPLLSRKKYNLDLLTLPFLTTSILAILGEYNGKILSTPTSKEIFLTVKVLLMPELSIAITIPSKI